MPSNVSIFGNKENMRRGRGSGIYAVLISTTDRNTEKCSKLFLFEHACIWSPQIQSSIIERHSAPQYFTAIY